MDILKLLTNCKVASTVRQADDEAAWLAARTKGIGGSDIGAICGVSPFSSARQVYFAKTGMYPEGMSSEASAASRERMHFGTVLEPVVAAEYASRFNKKLVTVNATLSHKDFPWALANVDRLILDDEGNIEGVLECKTTSEYMNDEWDSGEILKSYLYQLNWYLWILDLKKGTFACLVGGNKFYSYDIIRNDELLEEVLIPAARTFWFDHVLKLEVPPLQQTDKEMVNELYADVVKGSEIFRPDDVTNDLAEVVVSCKAQIKTLEKTMEAAQNHLKELLAENEICHTKDYIVKWSPQSQRRVSTELLKKNYPEVYEECATVTSFRRMTIKGVF